MEHLLVGFDGLAESLRGGTILLLDYDGTLVPIAEKPELAVIPSDMRALLRSLAWRFKVVVISGRALVEVKELVGIKRCYYVGNHGLEIEGPGIRIIQPEAKRTRPIIKHICRELRTRLRGTKGATVEDKGLTASVHYRLVKRGDIKNLKNIFLNTVTPYSNSGEIKVTCGKKVIELRPNVDCNKGNAALLLIDHVDPEGKLKPIYLGDDETDEDAFRALKNRGITVLISEKRRKSHAEFYLRNIAEVKTFLKRLAVAAD